MFQNQADGRDRPTGLRGDLPRYGVDRPAAASHEFRRPSDDPFALRPGELGEVAPARHQVRVLRHESPHASIGK
jgi:hypothetical protein